MNEFQRTMPLRNLPALVSLLKEWNVEVVWSNNRCSFRLNEVMTAEEIRAFQRAITPLIGIEPENNYPKHLLQAPEEP